MMAADWMQWPYVYALYTYYGFDIAQIGILFIVGFGSSMLVGTFIGSMADKYGRKKLCLLFGLLYSLSCITKHFGSYPVLMIGRVLGGISTSILFSSFESWMVHEHHDKGYPDEWLGLTFAACTSGNGLIAISSGVVASLVRDTWGPVAPFDASLLLLIVGSAVIWSNWSDNYGDSRIDMSSTLRNAWQRLASDRKIVLLGFVQSFFEGGMYVFVFMWTPALESTSDYEIYHGWIFASFMICVLYGSNLFTYLLEKQHRVEKTAMNMFMVAAVALAVPAFVENHTIRLLSFFVFEVCVGMFWPCSGVMRSKYVPEEVRATTMNFFRVPLNLIVVCVLSNIGKLSEFAVFLLCTACILPALLCQIQLVALTVESPDNVKKNLPDDTQMTSVATSH
jgi:MFS family permease